MAAEGMQSHDQSRGNCPTASHPATKKGRINAPILPKPARCAKSDRLLGPDVPICADANYGFSYHAARRYLAATREADLLFLEQPFADGDLKSLAALAHTTATPIGADEGIHSLHDIEAHAAAGAGGVSLKLIKLGGFTAALTAGALCRRLGLAINVAGKIAESSLGAAAAA